VNAELLIDHAWGGRAAQFAPFAALTGYEDAIKDTAQDNADSYETKNNHNKHINP
jgi:hypothetical protein